jgi:hypothetical protein
MADCLHITYKKYSCDSSHGLCHPVVMLALFDSQMTAVSKLPAQAYLTALLAALQNTSMLPADWHKPTF